MAEVAQKFILDDIKNRRDREALAELLVERAKWTRIKAEAEENAKLASEAAIPLLKKLGITNIKAPDDNGDDKVFILTRGVNASISREKLLIANVDPDTIDQCTVRTEYFTVQCRKAGA